MFVNLFISKWRHPDAAVRIQAITKFNLSHPADFEKLWQLVVNDPSLDVQSAAVSRLESKDKLFELLGFDQQSHLIEQAARRITTLFDAKVISLNDLKQLSQTKMAVFLCHTLSSSIHEHLSIQIDQPELLANLAMHSPLVTTRQLAAKALQDEALIDQVRSYAKEHDKAVYRIIREQIKLKQQHALQQQAAVHQYDHLLQQLNELLRDDNDPHLAARVEHIHQQWHAVNIEANFEQYSQFQQKYGHIKEIIETQHQHLQALEQLAAEKRALAQRLSQFDALLLHTLSTFEYFDNTDADPFLALHNELNLLKQETLDIDQQQRCEALTHILDKCHSFADQATMLRCLTETAEQIFKDQPLNDQLLNDQLLNDQPPHEQHLETLSGKVNELLNSIADWPVDCPVPKHHQLIRNLHLDLQQQRNKLRLQKQAEVEHQQQQHQQELQQQQRIIIAQKEQLCVAMEALSDDEQVPSEKAQQIRALQQQWKQLDSTTPVSVKSLWDRFHKASQLAYAPCELYFREQSRLRHWNLSQREQICQLLETYFDRLDWSQPDWSALEQIVKKAKIEWREFSPVDRAPGKPLQVRFNLLIKRVDQAFNDYRQACADAKKLLIDEATELAQVADSEFAPATQRLKELQSEWKLIGAAEHARERQLWKAFRAQGDILFTRLRAQKKEANPNQTIEEIDARLLCVRLEILLNLPSPEVDEYLRMEYQMERLEEALETPTADEQIRALNTLRQEWHESGFNAVYPELGERFQLLLNQIKSE